MKYISWQQGKKIQAMAGKIHIVKQGETLSSITKKYGFSDWRKIYNHADNAEFRRKRTDPHIIYPGDKVTIPEKTVKEESGATEQTHRFQTKEDRLWLRIAFKDAGNQPVANTPYRLELGGKTIKAATDGEGLLDKEIPPQVKDAILIIEDQEIFLKIGYLDPIDTITGWQGRLNNLGYKAGEADGEESAETRSAIEEFQCEHDLKVDGIAGPATQAKLKKVHGC